MDFFVDTLTNNTNNVTNNNINNYTNEYYTTNEYTIEESKISHNIFFNPISFIAKSLEGDVGVVDSPIEHRRDLEKGKQIKNRSTYKSKLQKGNIFSMLIIIDSNKYYN